MLRETRSSRTWLPEERTERPIGQASLATGGGWLIHSNKHTFKIHRANQTRPLAVPRCCRTVHVRQSGRSSQIRSILLAFAVVCCANNFPKAKRSHPNVYMPAFRGIVSVRHNLRLSNDCFLRSLRRATTCRPLYQISAATSSHGVRQLVELLVNDLRIAADCVKTHIELASIAARSAARIGMSQAAM